MNQELAAVVNADHSVNFEWLSTDKEVGGAQKRVQDEVSARAHRDFGEGLLYLGFCDTRAQLSASLGFFRDFCGRFARALVQTPNLQRLRERAEVVLSDDDVSAVLYEIPFIAGSEHIDRGFLHRLWSVLNKKYQSDVANFDGSVDAYLKQYRPDIHLVGRIYFHLVESRKEGYPFAFLATYSVNVSEEGGSKHVPLKHALSTYGRNSAKLLELLSTVQIACQKSEFMAGLLESGEIFHPLALEVEDAFTFLKEVPVYEEAGILCRIPNWWRNKSAGVSMQINIGSTQPSHVGVESLLDFDAELLIGDTKISEAEIRRLLKETEGLMLIKGKWVEVDRTKLEKTLQAFEKAKELMESADLNLREAARFQLDIKERLDVDDEDISLNVSHGEWLNSVIEKLTHPHLIANVNPSKALKANLRDYQQKGLNWLSLMDSLQLGACLADDMGLGKTVQILALMSRIKRSSRKANLLILPASLVDNWVREIEKFLPTLRYYVAHPKLRHKDVAAIDESNVADINRYELIITTYSLAGRYEWLKEYHWNYVILDEAQAIKNPGTKQSREIKKIKATNRIILTGTPIENRLGDVWSLFDFLNPGLLGTVKEFASFAQKLDDHPSGYTKLRNVISPYILRRLKTDKSVISDLPEKVEMKTYAELSKKQVVLYKQFVDEIKAKLEEDIEGIEHRGIVLASIIKFKQICNHSDHYLGSSDYNENDSGKFKRLREVCETIAEKRERMLVFTQFREITEPLGAFLASIFNTKGLILTGSTNVKKRKELVDAFQGHEYVPFMVLSLKAGGVGLNLTAANHVVHFDRWWNPAVENQATDRVFRIGQKKNVIVHKFITKGTIEEKIDAMLEEKQKMSSEVVQSTGENWITEMNNDELMAMFTLSL